MQIFRYTIISHAVARVKSSDKKSERYTRHEQILKRRGLIRASTHMLIFMCWTERGLTYLMYRSR